MSRKVIRQAVVGSFFFAIFWFALLVNTPLTFRSIARVHPAHTGIMLLAPPYQHQSELENKV